MSRSRKDKNGGHRKTEISFSPALRNYGPVVWGETGKRYAKRLRSKLARRHTRLSIRDLEIIEPDEAEPFDYDDFLADMLYDDYLADEDDREWERSFDRDHYEEDLYEEDRYAEEDRYDYDVYRYEGGL